MRAWNLGVGVVLFSAALAGCQKPDMSEMMQAPARPAEMERLAQFVGTWEVTGTMKMAGSDESTTGQGTSTVGWGADGWVLVEQMEYTMGQDQKMHGTGVWWWDGQAKVYRNQWYDSFGSVGEGTIRWDDDAQTWRMKGKSCSSVDGSRTVGEGWIRFEGPNRQNWHWTEWNSWKTKKLFEMDGVSKRH
jgi:hypothetical protein